MVNILGNQYKEGMTDLLKRINCLSGVNPSLVVWTFGQLMKGRCFEEQQDINC